MTNAEELLAGRLNRQIEELDAAVVDRLERDRRVPERQRRVHLRPERRLDRAHRPVVHDARRAHRRAAGVADRLRRRRAGGALAEGRALDRRGGRPALVRLAAAATPSPNSAARAHVAVSPKGTVFATRRGRIDRCCVSSAAPTSRASTPCPSSARTSWRRSASGPSSSTKTRTASSSTTAASSFPTPGLRLQQSGAEHDAAYVATAAGLLEVPLGGGEVRELDNESPGSDDDGHGCRGAGVARRLRARGVGRDRPLPLRLRRGRADAARHRAAHGRLASRVPRQPRRHRAQQPHQRQRLARRLRPEARRQLGRGHPSRRERRGGGRGEELAADLRRHPRRAHRPEPAAARPRRRVRRAPGPHHDPRGARERHRPRRRRARRSPSTTEVVRGLGQARAHRRWARPAVLARRGRGGLGVVPLLGRRRPRGRGRGIRQRPHRARIRERAARLDPLRRRERRDRARRSRTTCSPTGTTPTATTSTS